MAKRKKHRKKKHTQPMPVVHSGQSTQSKVMANPVVTEPTAAKVTTPDTAEAGSAAETVYVKKDVRYSLVLIGIIILVFLVLYLLLQNPTVSTKVYGLIKLPNIGN